MSSSGLADPSPPGSCPFSMKISLARCLQSVTLMAVRLASSWKVKPFFQYKVVRWQGKTSCEGRGRGLNFGRARVGGGASESGIWSTLSESSGCGLCVEVKRKRDGPVHPAATNESRLPRGDPSVKKGSRKPYNMREKTLKTSHIILSMNKLVWV